MMNNNGVLILLLLIPLLSVSCYNYDEKPKPNNSTDWDVIVFTQRWPVTICSQWMQVNANNSCFLPTDGNIWTVHGIWPTKSGTRGPWNCNTNRFNESLIKEIESDLKQRWVNIENNTKPLSFWEHEWQKHGTCAQVLPVLNTELKYFSKGLEWNHMFNIHKLLLSSSIIPSLSGYTIEKIYSSIRNVLNHNPIMQCVIDKHTKESLLSEIQLCFDRALNMMDCDSVKELFDQVVKVGSVLTDCSLKKVVVYPSNVLPTHPPDVVRSDVRATIDDLLENRNYWITIYKTVKFLIWATI
ncbi:ribonuclease Oy [Photinus pyralis]|uniref:Uncharacterized protein n=2 Tax=Photinus pyralis TaxID=7054 RepID=A0A1Y1NHD2_PHOPY|nr:ribonuclease Oy [Photinus pyralis]